MNKQCMLYMPLLEAPKVVHRFCLFLGWLEECGEMQNIVRHEFEKFYFDFVMVY